MYMPCKNGTHIVASFQGAQYEKGEEKCNFTVVKTYKHYFSQMTKVNINSDKLY